MMNPVLQAALACAGKGWPVFPCHPGRKLAATPNGHLDATTDRAQIREWFADHPEMNLAVATGAPGPDVLNVDYRGPDANGHQTLRRLHQAGLVRGASACIGTPNQGVHVYFEGSTRPSDYLPGCHIGLIARGGYVLVPPSQSSREQYGGVNMPGKAGLDWDAAVRLLDPSRTGERPPARQADPEPPDHEAGI